MKVRSCRVSMNGRAVVAEINGLPYCALSASVILPMRHVLSSYPSHPRERKPLWSQSDLPKGPHHTEVSTSRVTMVAGDTLLASKRAYLALGWLPLVAGRSDTMDYPRRSNPWNLGILRHNPVLNADDRLSGNSTMIFQPIHLDAADYSAQRHPFLRPNKERVWEGHNTYIPLLSMKTGSMTRKILRPTH